MSVDQFLLSADTTDLNYPEIRPTLDLNFARVKALDPRITFTRSSGGSYVGADGLIKYAGVNEARFDHDPETGESLGLLVEEARTNLLQRSQEYNISPWSQGFSGNANSFPNSLEAPDGTNTAVLLEDTQTSGVNSRLQSVNITSGTSTYTGSVYIKSGTSSISSVRLTLGGGTTVIGEVVVDTKNKVAQWRSGGNAGTSFTITLLPSDWVRVSVTVTDNSSGNNVANLDLRPAFSNIFSNILDLSAIGSAYFWGAQLEQGAFPTSYIPTQASTRTRAADNASITGKNFSGWYRQDEGTVFVSHKALEGLKNRVASSIIYNISTGPTFLSFFYNTNSDRSDIFVFGREYGDLVRFQQNQPTRNKVIFAYDAPSSDYSPYIDGAKITNITTTKLYKPSNYDTLTLAPTPSKLNGTISRLTYFPKRLPNAQLQALTR
jgi:hypothetical protein